MTKQEHLDDVLFRISKTSNRLSIYLNEAPVLMCDLEKKSALEKKSEPEKNLSSEKKFDSEYLERIRTDWIDEVMPLTLDENEFGLKSLLTALSATIDAMNSILDVTINMVREADFISVNQTEEKIKKKTFREKLMEDHPECVDPESLGGCYGCPFTYGYEASMPSFCHSKFVSCGECWDRIAP